MTKKPKEQAQLFSAFSQRSAEILGSPWTFIIFLMLTIIWIALGYVLKFSELWIFLSHFIPGIVTLFLAISIQNSENRSNKAIQIKLSELILTHDEARNSIIDLSKLSDQQLKELEEKYEALCKVEPEAIKPPD